MLKIISTIADKNKIKTAFTLAELLITLAIIGIVATLTIAILLKDFRKQQYKTQYRKMYNIITKAFNTTKLEMGGNPSCFYWSANAKKEWGSNPNQIANCIEKADGTCEKYEDQDGNPLAGDYNGRFSECSIQKAIFVKQLNVLQKCTKARTGASTDCIPYYEGQDTINMTKLEQENNAKDEDEKLSDEELIFKNNQATRGSGLKKSGINGGVAYVLGDGLILINPGAQIMVVDINGKKGPNKWGTDVFGFMVQGDPKGKTNKYTPYGSFYEQKDGMSGNAMLKKAFQ